MIRWYYWESETSNGSFQAYSDDDARRRVMGIPKWLILYRESDTSNGLPFVQL
jgi:hypothetical protein